MPLVLETATMQISEDELCLSLHERVSPAPDGKSFHRYQMIRVVRHDQPASFIWDMGRRELYNRGPIDVSAGVIYLTNGECIAAPFKIPYGRIHKIEPLYRVGNVMEWADDMRAETHVEEHLPPPIDMVQGYLDHMEELAKWRKHRSVFGPFVRIERNP